MNPKKSKCFVLCSGFPARRSTIFKSKSQSEERRVPVTGFERGPVCKNQESIVHTPLPNVVPEAGAFLVTELRGLSHVYSAYTLHSSPFIPDASLKPGA